MSLSISNEVFVQNVDETSHKKQHKRSGGRHHHHHRKRSKERRKYEQSDIPDWIKAEMEVASKEMQQPRQRDRQAGQAAAAEKGAHVHKERKKSSGVDEEQLKRMQKEFELKRKELLLQAENVVRMREEAYNQELFRLQTELEKQKRRRTEESLDKSNDKESVQTDKSEHGRCILQ